MIRHAARPPILKPMSLRAKAQLQCLHIHKPQITQAGRLGFLDGTHHITTLVPLNVYLRTSPVETHDIVRLTQQQLLNCLMISMDFILTRISSSFLGLVRKGV